MKNIGYLFLLISAIYFIVTITDRLVTKTGDWRAPFFSKQVSGSFPLRIRQPDGAITHAEVSVTVEGLSIWLAVYQDSHILPIGENVDFKATNNKGDSFSFKTSKASDRFSKVDFFYSPRLCGFIALSRKIKILGTSGNGKEATRYLFEIPDGSLFANALRLARVELSEAEYDYADTVKWKMREIERQAQADYDYANTVKRERHKSEEDERWRIKRQDKKALVVNSGWDGSVYQVKSYLKSNLKDPGSYDGIEWSKVLQRSENGYMVRHKYRAKNSFGGYVIENKIFYLTEYGDVYYTEDY